MVRLPASWHRAAGTWGGPRIGQVARTAISVRPPPMPVQHMQTRHRGPIRSDGTNQGVISGSGTATVRVGPSGLGTKWYPVKADISTTTGPADTSTCLIYVGAQIIPNQQAGTSYAGGGDTIALPTMDMQPGEFVFAVWSGGNPGDTATLRITGEESWLS